MKVSCWQHHFLLLRSVPARQAGYAEALGCEEGAIVNRRFNETRLLSLFFFGFLSLFAWLFFRFSLLCFLSLFLF
jgi:hypothetical protein